MDPAVVMEGLQEVGASYFSPGNPTQTTLLLSWLTRSVPLRGEIQAFCLPARLPACAAAAGTGRGEAPGSAILMADE